MLLRQCQTVSDVGFRVGIHKSLFAFGHVCIVGDVGRTRIHDRPLDEPGNDKLFHRTETLGRRERHRRINAASEGHRGITDHIHPGANPLDDRGVDFIIVALPSTDRVIGVEMQDRCPRVGASNRVGDDLIGCDGNTRLPGSGPGPIEGNFKPYKSVHIDSIF